LGSVLGFEIRLDPSWFILFFLILWTLGAGFFPETTPDLSVSTHALMAVAGTVLFFASLLLHEISHSLVARAKGIPMKGITLFVFGGLAHTSREPDDANDELQIAAIGPVVSLILGGLFLVIAAFGRGLEWSPAVYEVAQYLGFINVALAVFNLVPGYPLDGGRIFRALAWRYTDDLGRATRWATTGGRWVGLALIVLGILDALAGALLSGIWLLLIGMFLRGASGAAMRQYALRQTLQGMHARDIMGPEPQTVPGTSTVAEWVQGPLMRTSGPAAPVTDDGHVVGLIAVDQVERVPRADWSGTRIHDVMTPLDDREVVRPDTDMADVLAKVGASEDGQVLVMESGAVLGTIARRDLVELARRASLLARH
jgi:Zn-dependent protease/predicted transcriptional regulator